MPRSCHLTFPVLLLTIIFAGCDGPSTVEATPRSSKYEAEFGPREQSNKDASNNAVEASFLTDNYFACLKIDLPSLMRSNDLKQIEWSDLEKIASEYLGNANSQLKNIKTIWIALDNSSLRAERSESSESAPFVVVVDFLGSFDEVAVTEAMETLNSNVWRHRSLSKSRIAIGSNKALSDLNTKESTNSELAGLTAEWGSDSAIQAALTLSPVRSFLRSMFNMAQGFPEAQKFANLPNALKSIVMKLKLDGQGDEPVLIEGLISTDDNELASTLADTINRVTGDNGSGAFGINQPGIARAFDNETLFFQPELPKRLVDMAKEISEQQLLSVRNREGEIEIKLSKPKSFSAAIAASVVDTKKQIEISERTRKLQVIADALKEYEDTHNCLPSLTPISAELAKEKNVPAQFGWRTAILPYMNQSKLYSQFDFTKPWDDEVNMNVAQTIPDVFVSNSDDDSTTFQLLAGSECVYRASRAQPTLSDFSDRKIWTALVLEADAKATEIWIEPSFLDADNLSMDGLGRDAENGILSINGSFKVRAIKKDRDQIQKYLTSDGGEKMKKAEFINLLPSQ